MAKLRKQRRRKVYRYNVNRKRLRNKIFSEGTIECKEIKNAWESQKSVKQNLTDMGLAYDANQIVPLQTRKKFRIKEIKSGTEEWLEEDASKTEVNTSKAQVVQELIKDAKAPRAKRFRLPKNQVEWITYLLDKYGTDYRAMARDKKNYNQETWKQLRAKVKLFKSVPEQYSEYVKRTGRDIVTNDVDSDNEL